MTQTQELLKQAYEALENIVPSGHIAFDSTLREAMSDLDVLIRWAEEDGE